jgi:hypothetical protein
MPAFQRAVPVLQVIDVEKSIDWYVGTFGFRAEPFPQNPPYSFAILTRDDAEIMLQRAPTPHPAEPNDTIQTSHGWSVYLRVLGADLLDLATTIRRTTPLLRGPERMFYGLVEFEVIDLDGYRICVGGPLPLTADVPPAREREDEVS